MTPATMPAPLASRAASVARRACVAVLDVLLPPHCPTCAEQVTAQGTFCSPCFGQLPFITAPFCTGCGLPFASTAQGGTLGLCPACLAHPPPWHEARAAFLYTEAARHLILPLKHAGRLDLAPVLAAHMARNGAPLLRRADLLVPVPLHRWRLMRRGFNQAAELARRLGRTAHRPVLPDALLRPRPTPSLGTLSAEARAAALHGAILVNPRHAARLAGRRVLVVDDVLTSGATARACTAALLAAGARDVDVLVAARVADPRD